MSKPDTLMIDDVKYVKADSVKPATATGPECIVRTYSAGVHIGVVKSRSGTEVELTGARRLWSWEGAFTLNEVATGGVKRASSRISKPIPSILLLQSIEIIPVALGVDLSTTEK